MTKTEKIANILINENAYFYQNINNVNISISKIIEQFRIVSSIKTSNYLINKVKIRLNEENIYYSICVFKYSTKPTFIDEPINGWQEEKLAYLLIVEIEDFLVISRKNISKLQEFTKLFKTLDYDTLSTLFVNEDTSFEKFSLKNLNVSDKALREKTVEAIDLKENFSSLGANNYMLNSLRVKNNNEKTSLILNSSRINKFGKKNNINSFCKWSKNLIQQIKNHTASDTFLSIFAEPQDYESLKNSLIPISILFNFSSIYTDFELGIISEIIFIQKDTEDNLITREINIIPFLTKFERLCKITFHNDIYTIENSTSNDLQLKLNEKSISIKSNKLRNVRVIYANGVNMSIIEYINSKNSYIINFDNVDLAYSNRKLFKDNRLLGSISNFLKIFKPHIDLNTVTSEKGNFQPTSTNFDSDSIFGFVENNFINDYDFFICDDLGKEWADHIGVSDNKISFFHSKYNTTSASASAFQDIVGQAQKNLGNLTPQDFQLNSKSNLWNNNYNSTDGVNTNIQRLRKGSNTTDLVNQMKLTSNNPYLRKEIFLIINFISKSSLETFLQNLIDGIAFTERNETIQILWFISSLISSCQELNTEVTIYCKP